VVLLTAHGPVASKRASTLSPDETVVVVVLTGLDVDVVDGAEVDVVESPHGPRSTHVTYHGGMPELPGSVWGEVK
jgi:hypothetical protein